MRTRRNMVAVARAATDASGSGHLVLHPTDPLEERCTTLVADPLSSVAVPSSPIEVSADGSTYLVRELGGRTVQLCFETLREQAGRAS